MRFERDFACLHDCNAVFVKFEDGVVLGHLEQHVSAAIAPLMDRNIPGFIIRG